MKTRKATIETVLSNHVDLESTAKLQAQIGSVTKTLLIFDARETDYICSAFIGLLYQLNQTNVILIQHSKETAKIFKMLGVEL